MKKPELKKHFNLFHDKYFLGSVTTNNSLDVSKNYQGALSLRKAAVQNIGWQANRYYEAFKALEAFIVKKEIENIPEKELLKTDEYQKLCEGEIAHYLFEGQYYLSDRFDKHYKIELLGIHEKTIVFTLEEKLKDFHLQNDYSFLDSFQNIFDFTLVADSKGMHSFGGPCHWKINNQKQDIHLTFELDLRDTLLPLISKLGISKLPLLYCLNSSDDFQYEIVSDGKINVIQMEDFDEEMITCKELPKTSFSVRELSYEEKRMRALHNHEANDGQNEEDKLLWEKLGGNTPHLFGGKAAFNQESVSCLNSKCNHKKPVELFFTLVPFKINGNSEFWEEWDSEFIDICFYICRSCKNIIVRNSVC